MFSRRLPTAALSVEMRERTHEPLPGRIESSFTQACRKLTIHFIGDMPRSLDGEADEHKGGNDRYVILVFTVR